MPRTQYKGTKAYNKYLKQDMDAVGFYGPDEDRGVYFDMLPKLAKFLRKRAEKEDYQNVIVIEGRTGSGKSTLAMQLALLLDPDFDIRESYIYTMSDLWDKIRRAQGGIRGMSPVNLLDEGTVALNAKNSLRREDKTAIVMLQIMRSLNWTTIICVPSFGDLNKAIREQLVDFRIMCPDKPLLDKNKFKSRGFFEVYRPKFPKFSEFGSIFWQLIGAGVYDDLPPDVRAAYRQVKLERQMQWAEDNLNGQENGESCS